MYDYIPDGNHVYVEIPGEGIISGILHDNGLRIPAFVSPPHPAYDYRKLAYVRMANGHGRYAQLNKTVHMENNSSVHGLRCYIPISDNLVYTAYLYPYVYELHFSSSPRIFVKLQFQDIYIYTGILHRESVFPAYLRH